MTNANVMIATPAFANMVSAIYMTSVIDLKLEAHKRDIPLDIKTCGNESLITRARNNLVALFLDNPHYTHLMFIDADIGFNPLAFFKMLDFDKDIVSGVYPHKTINWSKLKNIADTNPQQIPQKLLHYNLNIANPEKTEYLNGFIKVLDAATGFMLIKKNVFEKMIDAYPELAYKADCNGATSLNQLKHWAFFDCMIDPTSKRYLSEDYTFCRRWQQLNGEIWCDVTSPMSHMGNYIFQGDVSSIVSVK